MPTGNWHKGDRGGIVADLLDVRRHLLLDLLEAGLRIRWVGHVHLVDANDQLLHPQREGEQGVLAGLSVLRNARLELADTSRDDQHRAVRLTGPGDHVLDEVAMTGRVDDGDVVLGRLELPQGDVDGDAALTFRLQLVQHPGVLERALAHLLRLFLELLDRPLVDAAAFVDQVTGGRGFARVHVADHHDIYVDLLLAHGAGNLITCRNKCKSDYQ